MSQEVNYSFEEIQDPNQIQREVNQIVSLAPFSTFERESSRNPYSFSFKKSLSDDFSLSMSPERGKKSKSKQRSRSMWGAKNEKSLSSAAKDASKSSTLVPKSNSSADSNFKQMTDSNVMYRFGMPREVILIPLWRPDINEHQRQQQNGLWEFELLSEEEVSEDILH